MKREWDIDEIIEHFSLLPSDRAFLGENKSHNYLGKALLLKFFQHEYRFPERPSEIPDSIISYMAQQLEVPRDIFKQYKWQGRSIKQHRHEIGLWVTKPRYGVI